MYENIQGLYFFTATCLNWISLLQDPNARIFVIQSLDYYVKNELCKIYGFVVMPNHIHLLIGIKNEDKKYFQHSFLKYTAQTLIARMKSENHPLLSKIISTQKDRKFHFWERNPKWISLITSNIFYQKLNYIHYNPLQPKWKLAKFPEDYHESSALSYHLGRVLFPCLELYSEF